MQKTVRAGIYARVSTEDKGQNPETQLGLLRDYCQDRGWQFQEYVDHASGGKSNRVALSQLKHDINHRKVNCVIIYKLDRLARSLRELLELGDEWGAHGVDLISLTETIDTTSPQGRLVFQLFGAMAEFERGLIAERVKAGMMRAKRQGASVGRPRLGARIPKKLINQLYNGDISVAEAARRAGISRMTLTRRLEERRIILAQKGI